MRAIAAALTGVVMILATPVSATHERHATEKAGHHMQVIWSDEFNGTGGTYPDPSKWEPRVTDQWQDPGELQNYTTDPINASLDGMGNLSIAAVLGQSGGKPYSSARFRSKPSFLYGLIEARIQVPSGQGIWPAFWMIGPDNPLGWPACGEIDIIETPSIAGQPFQVHSGIHAPSANNANVSVGNNPVSADLAWHLYALDWQRDSLEWFDDGKSIGKITRAQVESDGGKWVFNALPEQIVLNVAVGGWAGTPGTWTVQQMLVDYVRVWQ